MTCSRRVRRSAVAGCVTAISAIGLLGVIASPASADSYCSDWDSGGMCTRLTMYDTYGSGPYAIDCSTTYYYAGRYNGADHYEVQESHCW